MHIARAFRRASCVYNTWTRRKDQWESSERVHNQNQSNRKRELAEENKVKQKYIEKTANHLAELV